MHHQEPPRAAAPMTRLVAAVRRHRVLFGAMLLIASVAALGASLLRTPTYSATSKVLVSARGVPLSLAGGDAPAQQDPVRLATTEAEVVKLRPVISAARSRLGITLETTEVLTDRVSVGLAPDSDLLSITVRDTSRDQARALADAVAVAYVEFRTKLDTSRLQAARRELADRLDELKSSNQAAGSYYERVLLDYQQLTTLEKIGTASYAVVETADQAKKVSPRPFTDAAVSLILALMVSLGLTLLVDRLDHRVRDEEEAETVLGAPLVGRVPLSKGSRGVGHRPLVTLDEPSGSAAETFRMLRANLAFSTAVSESRAILITSALPGAGKSTIAANLAIAMAQAGRRVALVDLDLRKPTAHEFFGKPRSPGASDVIADQTSLEDAISWLDVPATTPSADGEDPRVAFLAAGTRAPNPGQLIASARCGALLRDLRERVDVVLVDAPPLLVTGDAMSLAPAVDACVFALNASSTGRSALREARRELASMGRPLLGFVMTGTRMPQRYGNYGEVPRDERRRSQDPARLRRTRPFASGRQVSS